MSNPQLSAYLDKVKIDHANHDDLELMLGNELASWASWSGDVLLRVLSYALEDANFHAESEVIDALHDLVCEDAEDMRDIEYAAVAVLRGEAPATTTFVIDASDPQHRTAAALERIAAALEAQQPVPAQDAAGDGDEGCDWQAEYEALQYEYNLYRWYAGERMPRPKGGRLRVDYDGTPRCPMCDEIMEWVLCDDDNPFDGWECGNCGTELEDDEHPSPSQLAASIDG